MSLPALRSLLAVGLLVLSLRVAPAAAGVDLLNHKVHALLDDATGWKHHKSVGEITVYSKPVPSLGLTAFKGIMTLPSDVNPERLFSVICAVEEQGKVAPMIVETNVFSRSGTSMAYSQVIRPPKLVPGSHRFVVQTGRIERNVDGEPGHHKRMWSAAPEGAHADIHAALRNKYKGAEEITVTHGTWELDPQPDGTVLYIYRGVSHPGGSVPDGLARMLSSRTLPNNMMDFLRAAR